MKMKELIDLTLTELLAKERDMRQELFNLNLQKTSSQLEKPHRIRELRKNIARIQTRLSQLKKQQNEQKVETK
ncbi:MAG: 50S ribosomal protein L29 [Verrucomicrobiia bacterium]